MRGLIAALAACLCPAFLSADAADPERQALIQSERDRMILMLERMVPTLRYMVEDKEGFTTQWLTTRFEGALPLPKGYPNSLKDELETTEEALDALSTNKPVTLEALRRYRAAIVDSELLDTLVISAVLNQVGVALIGGAATAFRYQYTFDDENWPSGLNQDIVPAATALARINDLHDRAAPEYLVEFLIGSVTVEANVPKDRKIAALQRLTDARLELEAVERSVDRLTLRVAELTDSISKEADQRAVPYRERLAKLELGSAAAANEKRYFETEMRALGGPLEAARTVLNSTIKDDLGPAQERVVAAETAVSQARYEGIPDVLKIETQHALLERTLDQHTELEQIEDALLALNHASVSLAQSRVVADEALVNSLAAASAANNDLALSASSSYLLQALAQAAVQITDAAIASKGSPHVFIAIAGVQATNNVLLSKPTYYDAELGPDGKPTTDAQALRRKLGEETAKSAANTLSKTGVGALAEQLTKLQDTARPTVQEALEHGSTRRAMGRRLGQTLSDIGERRSSNILVGILEGIVIDELTETAKQKIAREVTEDELRAYAAAQFQVAETVAALKLINLLEDRDAIAIAALRKRRQELLEERARLLPGQERLRPALKYVRNGLFEIAANQPITVTLSDADQAFDLLIAGVPARPGTANGTFTVGPDVLTTLGQGAEIRLPLTIRLR
ncbi:hypothetical protein [Pelagimonas varians]|uniref:Chromosome partition protein Smc n=1 Tax=Pelagimonas varians TaxID=696760 RepID=A0A238KSK8_9RHOB|nr:hypothetical protein [Pelagimonas varians]PYG32498.1 hypothetical protein C8N36_103247 [Pelagimonas varians]SMX45698.1 hypothetical protein PEV8663_03091 [Pelagimonas varians]